jgi:ABC-type polysaccharide/polyol phosphate transport system ATPase subunit
MSETAIRVQNLSKCYQIYDTPRDRLKQFVLPRLRGIAGKVRKQYFREFWALKDILFEVKKGETLGIIGRNGAGKSTLLQILCGTLTPSSGSVEINGRVAALLELGAGFNPEFTGRENVYMNASVLGLFKEEIDTHFDSIIAFADIGDFINQPVKTYSSGMFVRLAFAIAIHVEPNILIIDEALSVGDIAFQNKCVLKIRELRDKGTTLLFVTHDLSTLQLICDRVMWLHHGEIVMIGDPVIVSQEYYVETTGVQTGGNIRATVISQQETGMAKFIEVTHDIPISTAKPLFSVGDAIRFRLAVQAAKPIGRTVFSISIYRADGDWVVGQTSLEAGVFWEPRDVGGVQRGRLVLQPNCLAPGDYLVAFGAYSEDLSVCYALSDLGVPFSVRWDFPTWGKFIHPCQWIPMNQEHGAS